MTAEVQVFTPSRRTRYKSTPQKDAEELEALRLKILAWRDVDIAQQLGLSIPTVRKRMRAAIEKHGTSSVEEWRAVCAERLDMLMRAVTPGIAAGDLDAINTGLRVTDRFIKLIGADAPVKADIVVTQQTQQEKELSDLLDQLDRDQSVKVEG